MAVENKYVNTEIAAGSKPDNASLNEGDKLVLMQGTFEVAADDDDLSVYRIFKDINPNLIPVKFEVFNDVITSGSDYDIGFYETLEDGIGGAVIDKDALADGLDMSSGAAIGSPKNGIGAMLLEEVGSRLYELAGQTLLTKKKSYDIAITANTVGSIAGTISYRLWCVQG